MKSKSKIRMYLVKARDKKNYSMRKTARVADMAYQHYSKIENGDRGAKVSFIVMSRIADALSIPMEEMKKEEQKYQEIYDNDKD